MNSSRPLASPALGSGPLEAPPPRDSQIGAQTYQLQPSPLAPFKQANPPRPVSAARAPSQKAARKAETRAREDASEPRRARRRCQASSCPAASPRAPLPRFAPSGKQVQNQAKEAMRQSGQARKASSRLGAQDAGSRTGAGGFGQRRKRWHHSGFRPHSFDARPCSSPALYLGPGAPGAAGGGAEPQAGGEACESRHGWVGGRAQAGPKRACECISRRGPGLRVTEREEKEGAQGAGWRLNRASVTSWDLRGRAPADGEEMLGGARGRGGSRGKSRPGRAQGLPRVGRIPARRVARTCRSSPSALSCRGYLS